MQSPQNLACNVSLLASLPAKTTENCMQSMMNSNKPPHFMAVFLPTLTSDRLKVPLKFTKHLEGRTFGTVRLLGPSGNSWKVELMARDANLYLHDGWSTFVRDHSIQTGDCLIFRYDGDMRFSVQIFGESSCEKEEAFFATCSQQASFFRDRNVAREVKREKVEDPVSSSTVRDGSHITMKTPCNPMRISALGHSGTPINPRMDSQRDYGETKRVSSDGSMQDRLNRLFSPVYLVTPANTDMGSHVGGEELESMCRDENYQSPSSFNGDNGFDISMKPLVLAMSANGMMDSLIGKSSHDSLLNIPASKPGGAAIKKPKKAMERNDSISALVERTAARNFISNFPFFVRVMKFYNVSSRGTLKIPVPFSMAHLPKSRTRVDICNPRGDRWRLNSIPIVRSRTVQHCLYGGWKAFVRGNGIKMGDVCTFELVDECVLRVRISCLGLHGVYNHGRGGGCNESPLGSADISSISAKESEQKCSHGDSEVKDKFHEGEKAPSGMNCATETRGDVSCEESVEADRTLHRELKNESAPRSSYCEEMSADVSFTSSFPNFMKVMSISNIKGRYILYIPSKFSASHFPPCKIEIVLRNLEGRCWIVNSIPASKKGLRHMFCGGWSAFVRQNNIKSGDRCVFELIGEGEFLVHIFGAGHRKMECRLSGAAEERSSFDVDSTEGSILAKA